MYNYYSTYRKVCVLLALMDGILALFAWYRGQLTNFMEILLPLLGMQLLILVVGILFKSQCPQYGVIVSILLGIGNMMQAIVGNQSGWNFVKKEAVAFALAAILMGMIILGTRIFNKDILCFASTGLSIFVYGYTLLFGKTLNGSKAWIGITVGPLSVDCQASDLGRILCLIAIAAVLCQNTKSIRTRFMISLGILMPHTLFCGWMFKEMGTVVCLWLTWIIMVFLFLDAATAIKAGGAIGGLGTMGLLIAFLSHLIYARFKPNFYPITAGAGIWGKFSTRLDMLLHLQNADITDKARQLMLGRQGLQLGGLLGSSSSYLPDIPEQHAECVFALVCYRLGLITAILILLLFIMMIVYTFSITISNKEPLERGIALAFSLDIFITSFLSMAGCENAFLLIGIPTSFLSAGATSQMVTFLTCYYVIYVSRQKR